MLRTDLWAAAFVRRHNDLGHVCVVVRRGDPIAGQVFIEVDHLNGEVSLYTPAPMAARPEETADRVFQHRLNHVAPEIVLKRMEQEQRFDPDFWLLALEMRSGDLGLLVIAG